MEEDKAKTLILFARKSCFGLPTACPTCLSLYFYLRFANQPFDLQFVSGRVSDKIPFVENGNYVAYNNERGGVIEALMEDGIVDLDSGTIPESTPIKAMISSSLLDSVMYELWVGSDGSTAHKIYNSDLPSLIGKFLYHKQVYAVKQLLGFNKYNAEQIEAKIYRRATNAYKELSTRLGEQTFFFENRPTSLDAMFLGHALFVMQALPDSSVLRSKLLEHDNLIRYVEKLGMEFLEAGSLPSSLPWKSSLEPSSSLTPRRGGPLSWSSRLHSRPKRKRTQEEKASRRGFKHFLVGIFVSLVLLQTLLESSDQLVDDGDE